jgi:ribosomal protein S18 acetylase RimI-like enzyme
MLNAFPSNLRMLDVRRDLLAVADLIELCFARTMDEDGEIYLRHMRQAALDASFLHWAAGFTDRSSMPLSGYVWEVDGRIVGNLSLIPLIRQGRRVHLIANVAVHPDFRQRGIGRTLTETAIEHVRQRQSSAVWLQVRQDNPAAQHLYQTLGFVERVRRTTWQASPHLAKKMSALPVSMIITNRHRQDWDLQQPWLSSIYPPEVAWNLPINPQAFKPDWLGDLFRFFNNSSIRHWTARQNGQVLGVLTWEPARTAADNLWLATTTGQENTVIRNLLPYAMQNLAPYRPVALNYPAGCAEDAFIEAGFLNHQVLIWMEILFKA